MKQKHLKYTLIVVTALVWVVIIYKVFAALDAGDAVVTTIPAKNVSGPAIETKDSFFLYANYPDPFIPDTNIAAIESINEVSKTPPRQENSNLSVHSSNQTIPKVSINFVKYHGMIFNPSRKIKAALVTINNKELTLREKESAENITIKKIYADKMHLLYNHKMYTVLKLN